MNKVSIVVFRAGEYEDAEERIKVFRTVEAACRYASGMNEELRAAGIHREQIYIPRFPLRKKGADMQKKIGRIKIGGEFYVYEPFTVEES
jgi:hypothetical protein